MGPRNDRSRDLVSAIADPKPKGPKVQNISLGFTLKLLVGVAKLEAQIGRAHV